MRVLLVNPPVSTGGGVCPPLGLCALASWLSCQGYRPYILDLDALSKRDPVEHVRRFERALDDISPAVVGVTSMFNNSLIAERLIRRTKVLAPEVITVAGGPHFGALPAQSLRRIDALDYVVRGEGERAFAGLLAALSHGSPSEGVPGVASRRRDSTVGSELIDMRELPPLWPTLDGVLDWSLYRDQEGSGTIYIEAGRGCPFGCIFCATAPFWERKFRLKRPEVVVDEMRYLRAEYGYETFVLVHDLPTVDQDFVRELAERMLAARLGCRWMINNRPDIDLSGLLPLLRMAGCYKMFFGIESGSEAVLRGVKKHVSVPEAVENISRVLAAAITCTTSFVIGLPKESKEQLYQTLKLATLFKLNGAETVQLHRLRLWPPAVLSASNLPVAFDEAAVRLEHPFRQLTDEDLAQMRSDPIFFSGYFVVESDAGSEFELAQCERFFTYALASAPFTVAAIWHLAGTDALDSLLAVFALREIDLSSTSENVAQALDVIEPCLRRWIAHIPLAEWERRILIELLRYEKWRARLLMALPVGEQRSTETIDIASVLRCIETGQPLGAELLSTHLVRVGRDSTGMYAHLRPHAGTGAALCDYL